MCLFVSPPDARLPYISLTGADSLPGPCATHRRAHADRHSLTASVKHMTADGAAGREVVMVVGLVVGEGKWGLVTSPQTTSQGLECAGFPGIGSL